MTTDTAERTLEGALLLYHNVPPDASTILEHVGAFEQLSRYPVWPVNTDHGFPSALADAVPRVIIFHYSLFGTGTYRIGEEFIGFLDRAAAAYRIAFFQDEYQYIPQRFRFIDRHRIDCIFTLLSQQYGEQVYGLHTNASRVVSTIPGYVSENLIETAAEASLPDARRTIDIGYRARSLPYWMGRGSQEKREIATQFRALAATAGLDLDIEVDEGSRLYGRDWINFLANSRAVLGVEAGVSIFDLEDRARPIVERVMAAKPSASFEDVRELLTPFEDKIPYRTVSPRHFEAAAFRVLQILFEGDYSGVLQPWVHYLPLRKDFSNFHDVITKFRNPTVRRSITERAYADVIDSGRFSYSHLIDKLDSVLAECGKLHPADDRYRDRVAALLEHGTRLGRARARLRPHYRRWVPRKARVKMHDVVVGVRDRARARLRR